MQQAAGELHALHTIIGRSGAVPGFSILPAEARETVTFLFFDGLELVENARKALPNLDAVAEDAVHLVLRMEACAGERRTAVSSCLLKLQTRFRVPQAGEFYHGIGSSLPQGSWPKASSAPSATGAVTDYSDANSTQPFTSHQEYIDAVRRLADEFPGKMRRKD